MKYKSLFNLYIDTINKMSREQDYWIKFLEYAGNMYQYKFSTLVTAYAQHPELTQLVSYDDWRKLGYYIRKGEKSTPVLMDNHFKMSHMFDVTQLDKQPSIINWSVKDKDKEEFKALFMKKNSDLMNNLINDFDSLKAARILKGMNSVLTSERGTGGEESKATEQVRKESETILGGTSQSGTGEVDNQREDDRENEQYRDEDRGKGSGISNSNEGGNSNDIRQGNLAESRDDGIRKDSRITDTEKEAEYVDSTSFFNIKYFDINEESAKLAHSFMSFREYEDGSKTKAYRKKVDEVFQVAFQIKEAKPDEFDRAYRLAIKYAKELADNYNERSRIGCMCPSVMITGAGNFPVKKKEKQKLADEKNYRKLMEIEGIRDKLENILLGKQIIKSNDVHAIEKLEIKLVELIREQEIMKTANVFFRKHKTLVGCPGLSKETIDYFEQNKVVNQPFSGYTLRNNNQNINQVKKRVESLKKIKEQPNTEENYNGYKVVRNTEIMRLQLFFDEKPDEEKRTILKNNSFKWSPKQGAWQRQLTKNAEYALENVINELEQHQVN